MKNSVNEQSEFVNFLNQTQMFQGLSQEHLGRISEIAIAQLYNKGDIIFHQGDEARRSGKLE